MNSFNEQSITNVAILILTHQLDDAYPETQDSIRLIQQGIAGLGAQEPELLVRLVEQMVQNMR